MDRSTISAARLLLPPGSIYADWAASALPLPSPSPPSFIPPVHVPDHPSLLAARRALRTFLGDSHGHYHVIFTSGATAALRILADRLPWSHRDILLCHAHVHNAVLGMRNPALAAGARFRSLTSEELQEELKRRADLPNGPPCESPTHRDTAADRPPFALLAYPGECNLTGTVYPFSWARDFKQHGVLSYAPSELVTVLDTAKLAASAPLRLVDHAAYLDAVVFSLYKLSAAFTGLGALLVRKGSLLERLLRSTSPRSYFAGGKSVNAVSPFSSTLFVPADDLSQQLELGTPNMQAIHHLPAQLGHFSPPATVMDAIHRHSASIAALFVKQLVTAFSPENVTIHGDVGLSSSPSDSSVVSFTLYRTERPSGSRSIVGHSEIATVLAVNNIYARAGCMCNTGACCAVLGLSDEDVAVNFARGHRCGDDMDLILGKPTGVARVSFGWASLPQDAVSIVRTLRNHVCVSVQQSIPFFDNHEREIRQRFVVESLFVYPVKSCGGAQVTKMMCDGQGGAFGDRAFVIEDTESNKALNLRTCPGLAKLSARYSHSGCSLILEVQSDSLPRDVPTQKIIDLDRNIVLSARSAVSTPHLIEKEQQRRSATLLDFSTKSTVGGSHISDWLSTIIGRRVRLVRQKLHEDRCRSVGDILILSKDEMQALQAQSGIGNLSLVRASLRPNVVLERSSNSSHGQPVQDLAVNRFSCFQAETGIIPVRRGCTRCTVVNVVVRAMGVELPGEPLRTIARISRQKGQRGLVFGALGVFVDHDVECNVKISPCVNAYLMVGQEVWGKWNKQKGKCLASESKPEKSKQESILDERTCAGKHFDDPDSIRLE